MRSPIADLLSDLGRAFDTLGISWYLFEILASRPKDLDDVVSLLRIHPGDLDTVRIRTVLKMLEDALGQSDLLSAFEQCRSRAQAGRG